VATLEKLAGAGPGEGHRGEVFCCTYTPDGAFVLSGGWDGCLRLWDSSSAAGVTGFQASAKALSACAVTPDGTHWVSGSLEGVLSIWDAMTHQPRLSFLAHTRPVSAICYAPDGREVATASWDRQVMLRPVGKEREGRVLAGHQDIVAGCCYTPDGQQLLSWSHDGTVRLWDVTQGREVGLLPGHHDRVTALAQSPDGRWVVSGARDGALRVWDLPARASAGAVPLGSEVRACFFLFDASLLVAVGSDGRVVLLSVPDVEVRAELETGVKVQCAARAPSGTQVALGGEDGHVHLITLAGVEPTTLLVTPTLSTRETPSVLGRLLGKARVTTTYHYTCPACRRPAEAKSLPGRPFPCPHCRRSLKVNNREPQLQGH
jgi:WD40 repeat protein